jgi:hypothetical protein
MKTYLLQMLVLAAIAAPLLWAVCDRGVMDRIGDRVMSYMADSGLILMVVQQTPGQARVVDPILTTVAQGYKNAEFVGSMLFPEVPVDQRGGKIITFGKEDFMLYNTGRAPGAATKRVQFGYSGSAYALEQHSLEGLVPFEIMQDANAVPGIDLATVAIVKVQNIVALRTEKAMATLATTAANYAASNKATLAGTDQWSDPGSDPSADIAAAVDVVRSKVGKRANTVVLGPAVFAALQTHAKILDRIKYTSRDVVTTDLLATLWNVKRVVVGDAVYADDAGTFSDVWGKYVVVAYTETGSLADMGLPSYGYTYRLRGNPMVEQPYQDRPHKSWVYPVTDELSPVIAGALAGFLYSAVVA